MSTSEHAAAIHQRSVALVSLYGHDDAAGIRALLAQIDGPEAAAAQIVSLTGLCGLLCSRLPADQRGELLGQATAALAAAQGD